MAKAAGKIPGGDKYPDLLAGANRREVTPKARGATPKARGEKPEAAPAANAEPPVSLVPDQALKSEPVMIEHEFAVGKATRRRARDKVTFMMDVSVHDNLKKLATRLGRHKGDLLNEMIARVVGPQSILEEWYQEVPQAEGAE